MEFLQLKYFRHAALTENFSHTAKAFMVPPSSVSSSIKKLEAELGSALFERKSNTLSLNENGKIFLSAVNNIFAELERAKNSISTEVPQEKIKLLINSNRSLLTKIISEFRLFNSRIAFCLDFDGNADWDSYDIVVSDEASSDELFTTKEFIEEEILLAVHKDNPLSEKGVVFVDSLKNEKFICLHKNYSLRTITDNLCLESGFSPDIIIECDDPSCIRDYLKMGMEVSLVPSFSWKDQFDRDIRLIKIGEGVMRTTNVHINKNASNTAVEFAMHLLNYKNTP
ncbi:MAG: LysR family transcriptional regulator [Clostridia bacterium]|nr:LysR family transcriptional regulator [Clostridia bacterium]